jgi:hypothetical protein
MADVGADFSIADLIGYLSDKGAQVGDMERITVCTSTQRITLYVGVAAIEDVTPKLQVVK